MTLAEVFADLPNMEIRDEDENDQPIDPKNTFLNNYLVDDAHLEMEGDEPRSEIQRNKTD